MHAYITVVVWDLNDKTAETYTVWSLQFLKINNRVFEQNITRHNKSRKGKKLPMKAKNLVVMTSM